MSEAKQINNFDPYSVDINQIDLIRGDLFHGDNHIRVFERLRAEDPVYLQDHELAGRFWNITKYEDIMFVDTNHDLFSRRNIHGHGSPKQRI